MTDTMKITFNDNAATLEVTKNGEDSFTFNAVRQGQNVNITATKVEMEAIVALCAAAIE